LRRFLISRINALRYNRVDITGTGNLPSCWSRVRSSSPGESYVVRFQRGRACR